MKIIHISHPLTGFAGADEKNAIKLIKQVSGDNLNILIHSASGTSSLVNFLEKDNTVTQRNSNLVLIRSGLVEELWLYGDCIDRYMEKEIHLAYSLRTSVVPKTKGTSNDFKKMQLPEKPDYGELIFWVGFCIFFIAVFLLVFLKLQTDNVNN